VSETTPKITIGPLKIPGLKITKGQLLTITLPFIIPLKLEIPPADITFWPEITLLPAITVWDPEWILGILDEKVGWFGDIARGVVEGMIGWIIQKVFEAVRPYLDELARDFYARRGKE